MGFFDWLFGQPKPEYPIIPSMMAQVHKDTISKGKLPSIATNEIFLQKGEICYYSDNCRLMNEKVVKDYISKHYGHSGPGLFKGTHWASGFSKRVEVGQHVEKEFFDGTLFVTNKRTIFLHNSTGFDKRHTSITAIKPYSNAIEMQYGTKFYCIFVPDGYLLNDLFEMLH